MFQIFPLSLWADYYMKMSHPVSHDLECVVSLRRRKVSAFFWCGLDKVYDIHIPICGLIKMSCECVPVRRLPPKYKNKTQQTSLKIKSQIKSTRQRNKKTIQQHLNIPDIFGIPFSQNLNTFSENRFEFICERNSVGSEHCRKEIIIKTNWQLCSNSNKLDKNKYFFNWYRSPIDKKYETSPIN
jgi:hypothetical protein